MSEVEFHSVARKDEVPNGDILEVFVGDHEIALYGVDGEIYATDAICTHAYARLIDGYVEDGQIECPAHGGSFDIRTGKVIREPCTEPLRTYPVKIDGDTVLVGLPKTAG
jgi:nitrite reductase/ring-hydroxylating ferredoxin subunit